MWQFVRRDFFWSFGQGRPINVKHDARCVMGKVGGGDKNPKGGNFNLLLLIRGNRLTAFDINGLNASK